MLDANKPALWATLKVQNWEMMQISISIYMNTFSLGGKDFLVSRVIGLQFLTVELYSIDFRSLKLFSTISISRRENSRH